MKKSFEDEAFRGDFTLLLSSIQLTDLYTPFLRAKDFKGLQRLKQEILKLKPRVRNPSCPRHNPPELPNLQPD